MLDSTLNKRILEIAYKNRLSHLGSYFSSVDIIDTIYTEKAKDDIFILSSGHAALALYACLEKHEGRNAEELFRKHGGHPHLDEANGLYCSTGSLGLGITIAIGRAIANRNRKVHVLVSDGECAEGSVWESLKTIHEQRIDNMVVNVNINGYAAYMEVDQKYLSDRLLTFLPQIRLWYTKVEHFPFLRGINAHYHIMSEDDYRNGMETLETTNEKAI